MRMLVSCFPIMNLEGQFSNFMSKKWFLFLCVMLWWAHHLRCNKNTGDRRNFWHFQCIHQRTVNITYDLNFLLLMKWWLNSEGGVHSVFTWKASPTSMAGFSAYVTPKPIIWCKCLHLCWKNGQISAKKPLVPTITIL